jgi:uncharacterized protein
MSDAPALGLKLQSLPPMGRWAVLITASAIMGAALEWVRLPAALLLGPLVAAVLVQTAGGSVKVPNILLTGAQAVIGCLIARSITPAIVSGFVAHWPVFLSVVALSLGASVAIGWAMSRTGLMPGTTAVWGMLPGVATVMMVMAEAYGADFRLVAFMQYLRVMLVAGAASVVALVFTHGGVHLAGGYFPPVHLPDLGATIAVAVAGAAFGIVTRIRAGALLGPLALGAVLNVLGLIRIELPPVILIASYALIGWNTGLRFTRDVLAAAARALPQSLASIVLLMGFCGLLAWLLTAQLHIDPLTAYLATSPGGVDAAAIIAASTNVNMSFVMALQVFRVIVLLIIGPHVARWVANTFKRT